MILNTCGGSYPLLPQSLVVSITVLPYPHLSCCSEAKNTSSSLLRTLIKYKVHIFPSPADCYPAGQKCSCLSGILRLLRLRTYLFLKPYHWTLPVQITPTAWTELQIHGSWKPGRPATESCTVATNVCETFCGFSFISPTRNLEF